MAHRWTTSCGRQISPCIGPRKRDGIASWRRRTDGPRTGRTVRRSPTRPVARELHRARLGQPDDVAVGFGEHGDGGPALDRLGTHHPLGSLRLGQLQSGLQVLDLDIEGGHGRAHAPGDAARDAVVAALGDHPVVHGVVRVDVPAEHAGVELLRLGGVRAVDLEVDDWIRHRLRSSLLLTRGMGRKCRSAGRDPATSRAPNDPAHGHPTSTPTGVPERPSDTDCRLGLLVLTVASGPPNSVQPTSPQLFTPITVWASNQRYGAKSLRPAVTTRGVPAGSNTTVKLMPFWLADVSWSRATSPSGESRAS